MNRVFIIFKDGKVYAVRSTETLAEIAVNIAKVKFPKATFEYEGWEVTR